ncbi:MAG: hypothetical protein CFE24_06755 [Flavobacterium sp. BFFFF2]|nr:MAG: hypothetical protein CFE24_06755 [Flavobacterium sp. BFFFF2]
MTFDPNELPSIAVYKLLTGAVIPRPIAWVSSISPEGVPNLAPFSFFNVIGEDPPHLAFSTVRTNHQAKDTWNNIRKTGEFVVNMVTEDVVEAMNKTAESLAPEVNEFEWAGLTELTGHKVKVPRVAESPISFECQLVHHYQLEGHQNGGAVLIVGRIVLMHFAEGLLDDNYRIQLDKYHPVSRLAGANYAKLGEIFTVKRPV